MKTQAYIHARPIATTATNKLGLRTRLPEESIRTFCSITQNPNQRFFFPLLLLLFCFSGFHQTTDTMPWKRIGALMAWLLLRTATTHINLRRQSIHQIYQSRNNLPLPPSPSLPFCLLLPIIRALIHRLVFVAKTAHRRQQTSSHIIIIIITSRPTIPRAKARREEEEEEEVERAKAHKDFRNIEEEPTNKSKQKKTAYAWVWCGVLYSISSARKKAMEGRKQRPNAHPLLSSDRFNVCRSGATTCDLKADAGR